MMAGRWAAGRSLLLRIVGTDCENSLASRLSSFHTRDFHQGHSLKSPWRFSSESTLPSTSVQSRIAGYLSRRTTASKAKFDELLLDEARRRPHQGGSAGRKRRALTSSIKQPRNLQVVSLAIAESLDLYSLSADTAITNMYTATFIDEEFDYALHLVKKMEYTIDPSIISEAFIFSDGVIVFWNVDIETRAQMLRDLERHATGAYESVTAHAELDTIPFSTVGEGDSRISGECFLLDATKHAAAQHFKRDSVLERFAFSHGFAASVKLGIWEALLNGQAEPLANTTKELKQGRIRWNRNEALKKAGEFADLRHSINLNCSLLERDIYWERAGLENYYDATMRHLTIERRLRLLNNRLGYCEEMVKMVDNMLQVRHASTLEWMIIILIVIEVFFDLFHFMESRTPMLVTVVPPENPVETKEGTD